MIARSLVAKHILASTIVSKGIHINVELSEIEKEWLWRFEKLTDKLPRGLSLVINRDSSCGDVEVFTEAEQVFSRSHKIWINKFKKLLLEMPKTSKFWVLSNIDGLHVGKGYPTAISKSSYGVNGACSSYSDDFHAFYHTTVHVEYREVDESEYSNHDFEVIKTNLGDFRYWLITDFGKSLV